MNRILNTNWSASLKHFLYRLFNRFTIPKYLVLVHDLGAILLLFILAYLLRFNFETEHLELPVLMVHSIIAVLAYTLPVLFFRPFTGLIRHTTLTDVSLVFVSNTSSVSALIGFSVLAGALKTHEYMIVPVSIVLIHYVLVSTYLFFVRVAIKVMFVYAMNPKNSYGKKVLIFGAGEMGFIVKRVLLSDPRDGYIVAGFMDDNRRFHGKKINGIPVFKPDILETDFVSDNNIRTLVIAVRNIPAKRKSEIIGKALKVRLEVLEAPAAEKWLNGKLEIRQLQKVNLLDLLGREPIKLNQELIKKELKGKTVMVTGSAGSIGSELVRQLSVFETGIIILVDQGETPMFHLDNELKTKFPFLKYEIEIADVTNHEKMELIFRKYRPYIVFHAAAYKHVHLMEINPHEAMRVNVGGTRTVADLSQKHGVRKFILISTDKSVNPANIMGASKRMCELLIQTKLSEPDSSTQFIITRFGNVLGSNGSVIPLFRQQILEGGPVTVTHPDITRYFMTIPEACELVLEAGAMGKGGEIFVFDMGDPVRIYDMACNMIRLSGLEPEKDIRIIYTGLRPGEKLYEEVLSKSEKLLPTYHNKIKVAVGCEPDTFMILSGKTLFCQICTRYLRLRLWTALKNWFPAMFSRI